MPDKDCVVHGQKLVRLSVIVESIKESQERIETKIDKFIESCPDRFAGKWIEKVLIGTLIVIIGSVIVFAITRGG